MERAGGAMTKDPTKAKYRYGDACANSALLYNVATWGALDDSQLRAVDHASTTTYAHATNKHYQTHNEHHCNEVDIHEASTPHRWTTCCVPRA